MLVFMLGQGLYLTRHINSEAEAAPLAPSPERLP